MEQLDMDFKESKSLNLPHFNDDVNGFYMDFLKLLRDAKIQEQHNININTKLEVKLPNSDKVYKLSLSEISHVGNELLDLARLSILHPVDLLKTLYVINELTFKPKQPWKITTDIKMNLVRLYYNDIEYILEDFTEVYRTILKHSILGLFKDRATPQLREDLLGYGGDLTMDRTDVNKNGYLVFDTSS